jgi:hypothetical protein
VSTADSGSWITAAPLLDALQDATSDGGILVIKADNEREDRKIFTVVITGAKFGDRHFREDGGDLAAILKNALAFCGRS